MPPIGVFKPPGVYPQGGFLTSEYIVFTTDTSLKYWSININAGSGAELASIAVPLSANRSVAAKSPFVFIPTTAADLGQYAWNGSTLTQRYSGATGWPSAPQGLAILPGNSPYIVASATDGAYGMSVNQYALAPTYAYGTRGVTLPAGTFADKWYNEIRDVRVGKVGLPVVGDTICAVGSEDDQWIASFTVAGNVFTRHSTASPNHGVGNYQSAVGRDTGIVFLAQTTTCHIYAMDMVTRVLSYLGAGTLNNVPMAMVVVGNYLVIYYDTGLQCYSRSGTTLTLVNSLSLSVSQSNGNSRLMVSPYSDAIYFFNNVGTTNNLKVVTVNPTTGALTLKVTASVGSFNASGGVGAQLCAFIGAAALPTV